MPLLTHLQSDSEDTSKICMGANRTMKLFMCLIFVVMNIISTAKSIQDQLQENTISSFQFDWPVGDARRCLEQSRLGQMDVKRFSVLPGVGWDNLRNIEAGLVVSYNFTQCKVTDDGNFLIPDNVFTVPIKSSRVERIAEIIEEWHTSTSLTSKTINLEAGSSQRMFSISGKYSEEHEELRSKQIENKAVTARVQMRYDRYEAKLQPDPVLSPQFKKRLLSMAAHIKLNQTEQARYDAQLIVRDFGTHVLTSVTAGAGLVKDDYLKSDYVSSSTVTKTSILKSASASFMRIFKFSSSFSNTAETTVSDTYSAAVTHSVVKTLGGSLFQLENASLDIWSKDVDRNLVSMDRIGDPLYYLITPQTLPELPITIVNDVAEIIRQSIELYYEMNTVRGCTKPGSPNFSFSANLDDGSCSATPTNLTFGGFYQTCSVSGTFLYTNPCQNLDMINPKTGDHTCPPSYTPILIQSAVKTGPVESQRNCHTCWLLFKCCDTAQYQASGTYTSYWCAATGPVHANSGYLFGGLYTSTLDNPFTGTASCPPTFQHKPLLSDLNVCLSDDFEQSAPSSIPFGGFYSCSAGNPLASQNGQEVKNTSSTLTSKSADTSTNYLHTCPEGYSQHLATVEMGCSIYYCVRSGYLSGPELPVIKRPPFTPKPFTIIDDRDGFVIFNTETQTWMKNEQALNFQHMQDSSSKTEKKDELPAGAVAGISVAVTLVGVIIIALSIMGVIKCRAKYMKSRVNSTDNINDEEPKKSKETIEP